MRNFKSKGGFTLVELIVVIAILAILAGVAIPVYNGYIKRAQDAAVVTELDAISTAAQAANATEGEIAGISVIQKTEATATAPATATVTVTVPANGNFAKDYDSDFVLFLGEGTADTSTQTPGDFTVELDLAGTSYANGTNWTKADGWSK